MPDTITLTGLVATDLRHVVTSEGLAITSFRLASTHRKFDKHEQKWVDGETNWYGVTAFRQLAVNASTSLQKGERVIVSGRLRIKAWDNGEKSGLSVDIEADAIGHDLTWGSTTFSRSMSTATLPHAAPAGSGTSGGSASPAVSPASASPPASAGSETPQPESSPAPPF